MAQRLNLTLAMAAIKKSHEQKENVKKIKTAEPFEVSSFSYIWSRKGRSLIPLIFKFFNGRGLFRLIFTNFCVDIEDKKINTFIFFICLLPKIIFHLSYFLLRAI